MKIFCAVEDELSFAVAERLIRDSLLEVEIQRLDSQYGGNSRLRGNVAKYVRLSARQKVLLLTDLDSGVCAPQLQQDWLGNANLPDNLTFRVAVREVEAWLLADRTGIASLLGIAENIVPNHIEDEQNPKAILLRLTERGRNSSARQNLLPRGGANARVGLGYNSVLSEFVRTQWDIPRARKNSPSLDSAHRRISAIRP